MVQILQGDCREVLPTLEAGSVQCCITTTQTSTGRYGSGSRSTSSGC
jgi:hypothetical protein